ncbi:MAG TPA: hypothetical protein H9828_00685, partial [Candidatus Alistipes intestinigallinarum]|nr:hypothetical protein [Candidatus Alistipes intestinigallinarum]
SQFFSIFSSPSEQVHGEDVRFYKFQTFPTKKPHPGGNFIDNLSTKGEKTRPGYPGRVNGI